MSPQKTVFTMFQIIIMIIITRSISVFWFFSCSLFSWPFELNQQLRLLFLLKTNACGAVWVVMGEVGGSFILRMFQTHAQPSDANSSVHLAEQSKHSILWNLTYKANRRASGLPLNFKVHLTFSQFLSKRNTTAPKHGRGNQIMKTSFRVFHTDIHCITRCIHTASQQLKWKHAHL